MKGNLKWVSSCAKTTVVKKVLSGRKTAQTLKVTLQAKLFT